MGLHAQCTGVEALGAGIPGPLTNVGEDDSATTYSNRLLSTATGAVVAV